MNKNIKREIKKHLSALYMPLTILIVVALISFSVYAHFSECRNEVSHLFSLLSDVVTTTTLLLLILQIFWFYKDYCKKHARKAKEDALELIKYYIDIILPSYAFINEILRNSSISAELKKVHSLKLVSFDQGEYNTIFDNDEVKRLNSVIEDINIDALTEKSCFLRGRYHISSEDTSKKYVFPLIVDDTLNSLEYFCMAFRQGVADEKIAYQSLHQTFLRAVETLYFRITKRNYSATDKYYTNIIWLYRLWSERLEKSKLKEQLQNDMAINHGEPLA